MSDGQFEYGIKPVEKNEMPSVITEAALDRLMDQSHVRTIEEEQYQKEERQFDILQTIVFTIIIIISLCLFYVACFCGSARL